MGGASKPFIPSKAHMARLHQAAQFGMLPPDSSTPTWTINTQYATRGCRAARPCCQHCSTGGNLLFCSGGKGNRLTDRDLSLLTTHVHEANCRHCNLGITTTSSSSSTSAYSNALTPGVTTFWPPAGAAAAATAAGASSPAAAVAAAGAGTSPFTAGGGLVARQFSFSAALPGAGQPPQHPQAWYAGSMQHGRGSFSTNESAVSALGPAAGLWNNAMVPATAAGSSIAAATAAEQYGCSLCESDWFNLMAGRQSALGAAGAAGATTAVCAEQQHTNISSNNTSSGSGGSSGDRGSGQTLPMVPRSLQPASAAWQPAHARSQPHINSSSDTFVLGNFSSSSSSSNGMLGWQGPAQQAATRSCAAAGAAAGSSGGLLAGCSTSAPAAAAVGTAARTASHNHWPATAASSPALAALAAHQSALEQSAFHQSLLKAWGSYASLDGLEDSSSMCSICLAAFKPGVLITTLPCGHRYCKECVMPWLLQQGRQSTCPMCKAEVFT